MKLIYYITFFVFAICLAACSDDDENKADGSSLVLSASGEAIVLEEAKADDKAMTFTWNKGVDRGAEYTVLYIFRLDIFGANFATSTDPIEIEADGELSVSYTHKELNKLITKKWGYYPGDDVMLEARVVAKVTGPKFVYPEITTASMEIKSYLVEPKPLFILGDATLAGLDPNSAIKITEVENGSHYFWTGNLKAGKFKFISNIGELLPSLNKGADDHTLVERKTQTDPDEMFTIAQDGTYAISIFREEMTIDYKLAPYPNLFLVGSGCPADWDLGKSIQFLPDMTKPNVFYCESTLKEGEIKIYTARDWGSHAFRPLVADGSIDKDEVQVYEDGDDLKWKVQGSQSGSYRITLDVNSMKIKFEKL